MRASLWAIMGLAALAAPMVAQQPDLPARMAARGAAPEVAARVEALVQAVRQEGLPSDPIERKAFEGLAKRVPADRFLAALEQLRERLRHGRIEAEQAGLAAPPGAVVAAAAEALGRGMEAEEIRELIRRAPGPEDAAIGLTVAAALAAQGLDHRAATRAVRDAYGGGSGPEQLFELPSALAELNARGMRMPEIARRIMEGGGLPLPPVAGEGRGGSRPGAVPPQPGGGQRTDRGRRGN